MSTDLLDVWADAAALTGRFYASASGRLAGEGWFASLSSLPTTELNVCGLDATADRRSGQGLAAVLGPEQPALVFTSRSAPDSTRQELVDIGFDVTPILEPVMLSRKRPEPSGGPFQVRRCTARPDLDTALDLTAAAHQDDDPARAPGQGGGSRPALAGAQLRVGQVGGPLGPARLPCRQTSLRVTRVRCGRRVTQLRPRPRRRRPCRHRPAPVDRAGLTRLAGSAGTARRRRLGAALPPQGVRHPLGTARGWPTAGGRRVARQLSAQSFAERQNGCPAGSSRTRTVLFG